MAEESKQVIKIPSSSVIAQLKTGLNQTVDAVSLAVSLLGPGLKNFFDKFDVEEKQTSFIIARGLTSREAMHKVSLLEDDGLKSKLIPMIEPYLIKKDQKDKSDCKGLINLDLYEDEKGDIIDMEENDSERIGKLKVIIISRGFVQRKGGKMTIVLAYYRHEINQNFVSYICQSQSTNRKTVKLMKLEGSRMLFGQLSTKIPDLISLEDMTEAEVVAAIEEE